MASVVRYLITVALAAFITLSAFYLMHRLIDHEAAAPIDPPPVTSIHFGPIDIPEPPDSERPQPPEKPERQEPPPSNAVVSGFEPINRPLDIDASTRPGPESLQVFEATLGSPGSGSGRKARPVAAVPPPYPRKAALEGIEGWVRVAVDIDAQGRVRDVRVIEAEPRGFFEQAAVGAVRRWSWHPAVIDGRPQAQTVVQKLVFELDG